MLITLQIEEGTHVFHVVTFHQGTVSHGSAATNVLESRYWWNI